MVLGSTNQRLKDWRWKLGAIAKLVGLVLIWPDPSYSLTVEQIHQVAQQITVQVETLNPGSGVIIARQRHRYLVLTAAHVVPFAEDYMVQLPDGDRRRVLAANIQRLPNLDLALLEFQSERVYRVAQLADYDLIPGQYLFLSGFPQSLADRSPPQLVLMPGQLVPWRHAIPLAYAPFAEGYALFHSAIAEAGLSGGPLLDLDGRVVGLHGRSDGQRYYSVRAEQWFRVQLGYSAGIPVSQLLSLRPDLTFLLTRSPSSLPTRIDQHQIQTWQQQLSLAMMRPLEPASWINHANRLQRLGQLEDVSLLLEQAIALDPSFAPAWYSQGLWWAEQQNWSAAIAAYDQAVALDPKFLLAWRQRAIALVQMGQLDLAHQAFATATQIDPQNAITWYLWSCLGEASDMTLPTVSARWAQAGDFASHWASTLHCSDFISDSD